MAFDVIGARRAGYSDAEIANFVSQQRNFDAASARQAGYSDMDILGYLGIDASAPQPSAMEPVPERGFFGTVGARAGDIAGSLVSGAGSTATGVGGIGGILGITGYDNVLSRLGSRASEFGSELMSPELRNQRRALTAAMKEAEERGLQAEAGAALTTLATNPGLIGSMIVEQIPAFILSGGVGRVASLAGQVASRGALRAGAAAAEGTAARTAAEQAAVRVVERAGQVGAIGTAATLQTGGIADETYREVMGLPPETINNSPNYQRLLQTMSPDEARQAIASRAAREAAALGGAISVAAMTALPGAEKALFTRGVSRDAMRRALGVGASEAFSEAVEEGGGQAAQNLGIQRQADPSRDLSRGVGGAAAMGAALGGTMGAGIGALQRPPAAPPLNERPDLRGAIEGIVSGREPAGGGTRFPGAQGILPRERPLVDTPVGNLTVSQAVRYFERRFPELATLDDTQEKIRIGQTFLIQEQEARAGGRQVSEESRYRQEIATSPETEEAFRRAEVQRQTGRRAEEVIGRVPLERETPYAAGRRAEAEQAFSNVELQRRLGPVISTDAIRRDLADAEQQLGRLIDARKNAQVRLRNAENAPIIDAVAREGVEAEINQLNQLILGREQVRREIASRIPEIERQIRARENLQTQAQSAFDIAQSRRERREDISGMPGVDVPTGTIDTQPPGLATREAPQPGDDARAGAPLLTDMRYVLNPERDRSGRLIGGDPVVDILPSDVPGDGNVIAYVERQVGGNTYTVPIETTMDQLVQIPIRQDARSTQEATAAAVGPEQVAGRRGRGVDAEGQDLVPRRMVDRQGRETPTRSVDQTSPGPDYGPQYGQDEGEAPAPRLPAAQPVGPAPQARAERPAQTETFNIPVGKQFAVSTPDGSMKVDVVPEVVDLFSLISASGKYQNRMIGNIANQKTISDVENNPDFTRLSTSQYSDRGTPIIGEDNIIEVGNHRTEGLRRAAENNPQGFQGYVRALNEAGYDTSGMQFPVLIRRRVTNLTPEQRIDFIRLSNKGASQQFNDTEMAVEDASRLTPELLAKFDGEVTGGIRAAKNLQFVRDFIEEITTPDERTRLMTDKGDISDALAKRLENAIFAYAYNDIGLIKRAAESGQDDSKSITGGMVAATGVMRELTRAIEEGRIRPEFAIIETLTKAVDRLRSGRAMKLSPADILSTENLFEENKITPFEEGIIKLLSNDEMSQAAAKSTIGKRLKAYFEAVKDQAPGKQLVGGERRITPEEAVVAARNPGQVSMFSARRTGAAEEQTAPAAEEAAPNQDAARQIVNKYLAELRAMGRQGRLIANALEDLLKNRAMNANQIYQSFMIGETLAKTLPTKADYRIQFLQDIIVDNEQAGAASGAKVGQRAQGRVIYPTKSLPGFIELSLAEDMLPLLRETAAHEAFHVLQSYFSTYDTNFSDRINKFFKDDMKVSDLEPSIKRRLQGMTVPGQKISYYDVLVKGLGDELLTAKEAQAYAFGALIDAANRGQKVTALIPSFQRFITFARDFLNRMKRGLTGDGFTAPADILTQAQQRGAAMGQVAPTTAGQSYSTRAAPQAGRDETTQGPLTKTQADYSARATNTSTAEFTNWWNGGWREGGAQVGSSALTNSDGSPRVFYHGTPRSFSRFDKARSGSVKGETGPFFFTDDSDFAADYAESDMSAGGRGAPVKSGAKIYPVYLSAQNPFDYENPDHVRALLNAVRLPANNNSKDAASMLRQSVSRGMWRTLEQPYVQQALRSLEFDGFYLSEGGRKNLAVYDPRQVKSIFNRFESGAATEPQFSARRVPPLSTAMEQRAPTIEGQALSARVTDRDPELEEAARGVREGTVTREQYEQLVNERKPVLPYEQVPEPATEKQIIRALELTDPRKVSKVGVPSKTLKRGDLVGLRLDIPAYSKQNTWVVSVHEAKGQSFYAGTSIGYEPTAIATDVQLGVVPNAAMKIATGDIDKSTIAVMRGKWVPATPEQAKARADEAMSNPAWVQVGMDPRRHQYFYNRTNKEPVVSADEVIQVGPLVLAKNPTYASKANYEFSARRVPSEYAARSSGNVAGLPQFGQRVPGSTSAAVNAADLNVQYDVASRYVGKKLGRFVTPEKVERFFTKFQDSMLPVGRMIDGVKASGGSVPVAMDAYLKEDLLQGKVADMLDQRGKSLYTPVVEAVSKSGLTMQDFENYLYARHATERNAYIASINPKLPDGGSGLTNADARAMMAEFQRDGKAAKLNSLASMFDKIIADTNKLRVESGLTPDFSKIKKSEDGRPLPNYQNYAPLRGFADESVDADESAKDFRPKTGKMLGARGREDKRMTGRERMAGDILAHAIMQNTQAVIRSEQNKVGQSFLAMVRANPAQTKNIAEVINSAPLKTTIVNGVVKTVPDMFYKNSPDILVVKEGGKEIAIRIQDEGVARSMTGASALSPASKNILLQGMATLNRTLAKINTAYNPEFLITNFARDLQTFGVNVQQYNVDGIAKDSLRDLRGALSGVRDSVRGTDNNPEMKRAFERFRALGGTTEMYGFGDLESRVAEINKIMGEAGGQAKSWRDMAKTVMPVIKFIEDYNTIVENGIRTSLFKNLTDRGINEERAAQIAKNVTVNFTKGGENKVFMNSLYLFYNASLQGTMALVNSLGRSARVRKIVAGIVVGGILQDVMNSMLSGMDDDDEKVYDKIPDHILKRSFIMMDPFKITERGYFSFPMPYGFNAFFNMGREMSRASRGQSSPGKAAGNIIGTFIDSFNPIGGSENFYNFMAPTFADPIIDVARNRDFTGRPIVPERGSFGVQLPDSQKYWNNTFAPYVGVSNFVNSLTGGTPIIPGAVDISPNMIQYVVNFATGGVGKFVERSFNTATSTIPGLLRGDLAELDVRGIPFARSLYGSVTSREDMSVYMERMEEVLRVRKEISDASQSGQPERVNAAIERYPGQVQIMETFNRLSRDRAKISQRINEISRNQNIPDDSKSEIIKTMREQQNSMTRMANRLYVQNVENR